MKRAVLAILAVLYCGAAGAETLLDRGAAYIPEWKVQAVYSEKYLENRAYYGLYSLIGGVREGGYEYTQPLTAIAHEYILRLGLPEDFVINASFDFIYQRSGSLDSGGLHDVSVFAEKYEGPFRVSAGLKVPSGLNPPDDERFYRPQPGVSVIFGVSASRVLGPFGFAASLYGNSCLETSPSYSGEFSALAAAGWNFYSSDFQQAHLTLEAMYSARSNGGNWGASLYAAPQLRAEFFNDFYFTAGAGFVMYAVNSHLGQSGAPVFLVKAGYVINGARRDTAPKKEEKKAQDKDRKWWQIDGVDDEMIPETWKKAAAPPSAAGDGK
ncbi:MAG TPA: hypothetical protein P5511_02745 [Candidatus Goldiibacteriota bacterium]|nr:hypothetical protein [Candidatus Goldiibacteriota bacterium]